MVAISVILVTIAGTLASQLSSKRLNMTSAETSAAMSDLQACMEQVLLLPIEEIPIAGSEFEANQAVAQYDELHLTREAIVATYPDYTGGAVPDPLEIVLTISWRDHRGGTRSLQLACLKTQ